MGTGVVSLSSLEKETAASVMTVAAMRDAALLQEGGSVKGNSSWIQSVAIGTRKAARMTGNEGNWIDATRVMMTALWKVA